MTGTADRMPFAGSVAVVYICTGPYVAFWPGFFDSFEEHFLPANEVHYFVFTDASEIAGEPSCDRVHRIFQEQLPWPFGTLLRFQMMRSIADHLRSFDYVFFMNANLVCVRTVTEENLLPRPERGESLVVVQHPGFFAADLDEFTYDRNPLSQAYVPEGAGSTYVCGGVNGGTATAYLELVEELGRRVQLDLDNGIVALWHDESHLNRYIVDRDDFRLLSPSYCYPDRWDIPFDAILQLRDKREVMDVGALKGWPDSVSDRWWRRLLRGARPVQALLRREG